MPRLLSIVRALLAYSVLAVFLLLPTDATAQTYSTQGRDFWLMFLLQSFPSNINSIVVASEQGAMVTIYSTLTDSSTTIILPPMGSQQVVLSTDDDYSSYHVTATNDISVYASNYFPFSYDIATVYPTPTLRSRYMVQTYDNEDVQNSEVGIVAVEDNTQVSLYTPEGDTVTFTLQAGENRIHWVLSDPVDSTVGTMTGTVIEAANNKKIAVFQGNECAWVNYSTCDHLYEQAVPIDYWGREFIVTPLAGRMGDDVVKVTSLEDNCYLEVNDTFACILDAGESYLVHRYDTYKITSIKPVTVCLYMGRDMELHTMDTMMYHIGDPSAVIIPPVEQGMLQCTFAAINTNISTIHYANVVVQTCNVDSMRLDGEPIDTNFVSFDNRFSYARLSLTPGVHTLSNNSGMFQAIFYGMGITESYAYVAGMAMLDLEQVLYINDVPVTGDIHLCVGDTAWAELHTGNVFHDTRWRFDGVDLGSTDLRLPLYFDSAGTHTLQALLHGDCCQQWCDSLQVTLHVHPSYHRVVEDYICTGTPYRWNDTLLYDAGTYQDTLITADGCELTVLYLVDKYTPRFSIEHELNCFEHAFLLVVHKQDTVVWDYLRWSSSPYDPMLSGHEGDTVVNVSPSSNTTYTLHVETPCPVDSSLRLEPIVWPVAHLKVLPETVLFSESNSLDAYDFSQHVTGREWAVDGVPQSEEGPHLHYTLDQLVDSVSVLLTAYNEYCVDTAGAVVRVLATDLYAPNAFMPEADGNNRFVLMARHPIEGELSVYNREGLLVYRSTDLTEGWDGQGCPQGTYVWHLRYRFGFESSDKRHTAVGTVTLLR